MSSEWRYELKELLNDVERFKEKKNRGEEGKIRIKKYINDVVVPAFEEIAEELQNYNRDVDLDVEKSGATLKVFYDGEMEFYYAIKARIYKKRDFAFPMIPLSDSKGQIHRAEVFLKDGPTETDVTDMTREQIINNFLYEYRRHLRWLY